MVKTLGVEGYSIWGRAGHPPHPCSGGAAVFFFLFFSLFFFLNFENQSYIEVLPWLVIHIMGYNICAGCDLLI